MRRFFIFRIDLVVTLCLLLSSFTTEAQLKPVPQFKNGETVVFLGNSITRESMYLAYIKLFYLTRFPEMEVNFVNAGISGDITTSGIKRLDQDVMIHQPDKIVMMFGMNDANIEISEGATDKEKEQAIADRVVKYRNDMDSITRLISHRGVELIYMVPSIYDDKLEVERKARFGGNKTLGLFREVIYELAAKYNLSVVDLYTIMNKVNARYQKDDPKFTVVGNDRIHPGHSGHMLMAYQFLKSQKVSPLISDVVIDVKNMQVQTADNCKVSNLSQAGNQYFFAVKSNALPFPVEDKAASKWLPIHQELNQESLEVKGLEQGNYELSIDGKKIKTFSNVELEEGVNLADFYHTPQYQQAVLLRTMAYQQRELIKEKVRALSMFDYNMLHELPRVAPPNQVREKLDEELEKIKTKSYYGYLVAQSYKYMIYKPLTKESEAAIARLSESMRLLKEPLTHMYALKKMSNK